MLKYDGAGWGRISIGDWNDKCCCLDDVPHDLLEAVEETARTWHKTVREFDTFDAADCHYTIVFGRFETYIVSNKTAPDGNTVYSFTVANIPITEFGKELVADIRCNLDKWVKWPGAISEDEFAERKEDFEAICELIEKRIDSRGEHDDLSGQRSNDKD